MFDHPLAASFIVSDLRCARTANTDRCDNRVRKVGKGSFYYGRGSFTDKNGVVSTVLTLRLFDQTKNIPHENFNVLVGSLGARGHHDSYRSPVGVWRIQRRWPALCYKTEGVLLEL